MIILQIHGSRRLNDPHQPPALDAYIMTTYGEDLVRNLLKPLPKNEYDWYQETEIVTNGRSSYKVPDFIIVSAHAGVFVLEVKDFVEIVKADQKEITVRMRDGKTRSDTNPIKIAKEYALNLADRFQQRDELLVKKGRKKGKLKFLWRYAVVLPNITCNVIRQIGRQGIWEQGNVLGKEDLTPSNFAQRLNQIPGPFKMERPIDNDTLNVIRGVINPSWIVTDQDGEDIGTVTRAQAAEITRPIQISGPSNPQQKLFADDTLPPEVASLVQSLSVRLVRGVAGSGKSLVLARRAQYLAEQYPDLRILVMTYNVDLAADLRQRIGSLQNVEVINFHKMCSTILGKQWRSPSETKGWLKTRSSSLIDKLQLSVDFVADEIEYRKDMDLYDGAQYLEFERLGRGQALTRAKREIINQIFDEYIQYQHDAGVIDWPDVPRLTLSALQPGHPYWHHYDLILIDEAQDFAPTWIKVIKALLKPGGELFMCDDPTQSIFRYTTWRQRGIPVAGRTRVLRVPFRNTRNISVAAHALVAADPILSQSGEITQPELDSYSIPIGETPLLVDCHTLQQEIGFVRAKVLSLIESGVPASQIAILCHNKHLTEYWQDLCGRGVYVQSFWKMKGLEFSAVLIPHLHTLCDGAGRVLDEGTISEIRRRVFTAMTRAREILIMSYQSKFPAELSAIEPHMQVEHL
jgi:hypothetical protein